MIAASVLGAGALAFVASEAAFGWHEAVQDAQASFLTAVPSMVGASE